jgi:hypothetical protein
MYPGDAGVVASGHLQDGAACDDVFPDDDTALAKPADVTTQLQDYTRRGRIAAPIEEVWAWMSRPHNIFSLNVFHEAVSCDSETMRPGLDVAVLHRFGLTTQRRVSHVTRWEPWCVAWLESTEQGHDFYPHSQTLTLTPEPDGSCLIENHLRGRIDLPLAQLWFVPLYRLAAPRILDAEIRKLARSVDGKR